MKPLIDALTEELTRGIDVIRSVDDDAFATRSPHTGTIGGQLRHNLDVVTSLVRGFESGVIDYSGRNREVRIEVDREYAVSRYEQVIDLLRSAGSALLPEHVQVRSEIDPAGWFKSDLKREVEFVYSHTVHHHALIAEKMAALRCEPPLNLGVAPATLDYWKQAA